MRMSKCKHSKCTVILLSLDKKSKRSTTSSSQVRNYLLFSFRKNLGEYSSISIARKLRVLFSITFSLHCKHTERSCDCLDDVAKCGSHLLKKI